MEAIISADIHLREDTPRCRKDENWMKTQENHLGRLISESNKRDCPIIIVGDVFNRAVVPESVKRLFIESCKNLSNTITVIPGNHDLIHHSMTNLKDSSIGVIMAIAELENIKIVPMDVYANECSWQNFGENITNAGKDILFLHKLVFEHPKDLPPGSNDPTAQELLEMYPEYTWIFTGDCHKPFHYQKNGRHVVNPGHLNIQKANELDPPIFFYVDTDKEIIEKIPVGDNPELIDDEYLTDEEEKEDRIGTFIERVEMKGEVSLSFFDNIDQGLIVKKEELGEDGVFMVHLLMEGEK